MDWVDLAQDRDRGRAVVNAVKNLPWNSGNFLSNWKFVSFSERPLLNGVSKQVTIQ
jgi:hypothetical protein